VEQDEGERLGHGGSVDGSSVWAGREFWVGLSALGGLWGVCT
jgi:hypothetical protein